MLIGGAPFCFPDVGIPISRPAKVAAELFLLSPRGLRDGFAALQAGLFIGGLAADSGQIVPAAEGFHGIF